MASFLLDLLGRVLDLFGRTGRGGLVGSMLLLLALAAVGYGIVRAVRRIRRTAPAAGPEPRHTGRSATDWVREAQEHEAAGRWRAALRAHHRALVADLAAAGLVEEVPGRTAAEYEREAAAAVPSAGDPLAAVTRLFERAWYADAPVGPEDVAELQRLAAAVRGAAGRRPVAAAGSGSAR